MTSAPSTTEQENIMESEHKLGGQRSPAVVSGPLAGYATGFRQALIAQGYARRTVGDQMSMMAHLSRWLEAGGLDVKALQSATEIDRFFEERRAGGHRTRVSRAALSGLLGFLSDHEIIGAPTEPVTGPVGRLLAGYRAYLRDERGAAPGTIRGLTACAAMFLQSVAAPGNQPGEALSGLSAADVTRFVARWARSRSHAYSKSMVSALRSLMRFLHVAGYIPRPLDAAVPSVPGWQAVRRPHRVSGREITAILAACDRESARGRRDSIGIMARITISAFVPVSRDGLVALGLLRPAFADIVGPVHVEVAGEQEDLLLVVPQPAGERVAGVVAVVPAAEPVVDPPGFGGGVVAFEQAVEDLLVKGGAAAGAGVLDGRVGPVSMPISRAARSAGTFP
jgi:hypothetical protein